MQGLQAAQHHHQLLPRYCVARLSMPETSLGGAERVAGVTNAGMHYDKETHLTYHGNFSITRIKTFLISAGKCYNLKLCIKAVKLPRIQYIQKKTINYKSTAMRLERWKVLPPRGALPPCGDCRDLGTPFPCTPLSSGSPEGRQTCVHHPDFTTLFM